MPALGEEFRSAREARGLTLSNVAEQIYIRSVYLNAIEHEDWASIGAPVYVRGFIRTYARFLGLDAESAVERFNQAVPHEWPHVATAMPLPDRDRGGSGPSAWAIAGIVIAVVLVALVGYEWWSYGKNGTGIGRTALPTVASPAGGAQPTAVGSAFERPAAATTASPVPTLQPLVRNQLEIRLTERSWLRVVVDGSTKVEGIFPAGTLRTFSGHVADVRVGNAGGVSVSIDGKPASPMGKEGDVAEQRFTL